MARRNLRIIRGSLRVRSCKTGRGILMVACWFAIDTLNSLAVCESDTIVSNSGMQPLSMPITDIT